MKKNLGLKASVISMYKSRFQKSGFFKPKILEDFKISGKLKDHTVDIYFEFINMNNLERTIIKIIEDKEVTEKDIWEFAYILKDLHFFAKGILYYDDIISSEAKRAAELANIDLNKFNFFNEVLKNALSTIKIIIPDKDVVGDPFWVIMENIKDMGGATWNYKVHNDSILLFLSKNQASSYCSKFKGSFGVFGISQNHLNVLIDLRQKGLGPDLNIVFPEFMQTQSGSILAYKINYENFKKFYLRGESN